MQYHEVVTFLCGRFLGLVTAFFVMLNVFGISVAQVCGLQLGRLLLAHLLRQKVSRLDSCQARPASLHHGYHIQ